LQQHGAKGSPLGSPQRGTEYCEFIGYETANRGLYLRIQKVRRSKLAMGNQQTEIQQRIIWFLLKKETD